MVILHQSSVKSLLLAMTKLPDDFCIYENNVNTRSSWLNCALRDDEAVNWGSIGHYEAVAFGN